jgi:hypothetical protein
VVAMLIYGLISIYQALNSSTPTTREVVGDLQPV